MDQQQDDEMSDDLALACWNGHTSEIRSRLETGELVDSIDSNGTTPLMMAMSNNQLIAAQMLADRGADLSMINCKNGCNILHYAGGFGHRDCIEWVFANTTIDVNSTTRSGKTSIMRSLRNNRLDTSMLLVEEGANLFLKDNDGERAIDIRVHTDHDIVLGPQVLQHALDLRWSSVKHLLLISNFHEISDIVSPSSSSHLAASVFTITGLVRLIAEYLIRTEIIVRDPATKKKDPEPDDVKRRIEVTLAVAREESKQTRKT
jgi:ankyrin repeat protein